ncbi:glycoside hydrolase family 18 protein [Cunninghamella echinulata]|nr:glycoside hydrolase family 18 protein [Cunninghamella echinulata]
MFKSISLALVATTMLSIVNGFENNCNDNLAVYWGQNSYGAANGKDPSNWQKPLRTYCDDDSIDVIPTAFVTNFFGKGGLPVINLANICNNVDNATFPGTDLANCASVGEDIKYCQSKGKVVTLSLGGATGGVGFQSDSQATSFADTLWNLFFAGKSETRPFGSAVMDGIDLDIEGGGSNYYGTFLKQLRSNFAKDTKKYYVTAAPQCVYPDANLHKTISENNIDAIYVQFYNNPCGLQTWGTGGWNYGVWDYWAKNVSPNKDIKIYIGAPASTSSAGSGYVPLDRLSEIAVTTQKSFPTFGGVMFWDASQAVANGKINVGIKKAISANGSCGKAFQYPTCSAPAYQSGQGYPGGSKVSHDGYIWQAMWYASGPPDSSMQTWIPVSACSGSGSTPSTTTSTPTKTSSTSPTSTSTPGSEICGTIATWNEGSIYKGGDQVAYNGKIYQAKWWTQNQTPGSSDVWSLVGPCTKTSSLKSTKDVKRYVASIRRQNLSKRGAIVNK